MQETQREIAMPCCGLDLVVRLVFDVPPTPGTTVDVECPFCGETVGLVLYPIPVNRN